MAIDKINQLKQALIETQDFLAITLANELSLPAVNFLYHCANSQTLSLSIIDTGILEITPTDEKLRQQAKHIVLSSGIHGNETAPIEMCNTLIKQILRGEIVLKHRVMFIFGNPPAIKHQKRFLVDNLNSLFAINSIKTANDDKQSDEYQRARLLEKTICDFYLASEKQQISANNQRIHYDLHTAIRHSRHAKFAISPFLHGAPVNNDDTLFLSRCGISALLVADVPTPTFSYFVARHAKARSLTIELGKVKPFGENSHEDFSAAMNTLTALLTTKQSEYSQILNAAGNNETRSAITFYRIVKRIHKQSADFICHFADDVANFTPFKCGSLLVSDGELRYVSEHDEEAILFPNKQVPIGQRALLIVKPVGNLN